jgi:hypothetical protein
MDDIIGIPPRTALKCIVRKPYAWQIWMGIDDMQVPQSDWRGHYLELHDNGCAYSITVQPNGDESVIVIK